MGSLSMDRIYSVVLVSRAYDVKNLASLVNELLRLNWCCRMDDCLPIGRAKQFEQQILCESTVCNNQMKLKNKSNTFYSTGILVATFLAMFIRCSPSLCLILTKIYILI